MKKFIAFIFCGITFACIANAESININWIVDGETHTTTTCNIGDDLILPTAPTKYGYTFQGWTSYTPIEYLESTGRQYIDTGIKSTDSTITEVVFQFRLLGGSVFGVLQSNGVNYYGMASTATQYRLWYGSGGSPWVFGGTPDLAKHTAILRDRNLIVDDTVIAISNLSLESQYANMYLFGANFANQPYTLAHVNIYSAKIWDNGTLVRDFIPVLDQHGVPCMYDKVTQQFFYNSGTGDFIAGPLIGE